MKQVPELRCGCGCLLARWVPGGVELKCRRCKRVVVLRVGETEVVLSHAG
jgi:phage FluMu protein Com